MINFPKLISESSLNNIYINFNKIYNYNIYINKLKSKKLSSSSIKYKEFPMVFQYFVHLDLLILIAW